MKNRLTKTARTLRKNQTPQEAKLWRLVRNRRLLNTKFRRQFCIDYFIVDFCCLEKKLIIEIDGGHHNQEKQKNNDRARDFYLKNKNFKVLRIWNSEIDNNLDGVYQKIKYHLEHPHLSSQNNFGKTSSPFRERNT